MASILLRDAQGNLRDPAFDQESLRQKLKQVKARNEIDDLTFQEIDKQISSLSDFAGDSGAFESNIQRVRGTLRAAREGEGKFGLRMLMNQRRSAASKAPGRRATILTR